MSSQGGASASDPAEVRGFALFVGIDEFRALAEGTTLSELAAELKALVERLAPSAETFTSIAVAPSNSAGSDLEVVRHASRLLAKIPVDGPVAETETVLIDLSRRQIFIGTNVKLLTFTEFELLQYLVEHEGTAVSRHHLIGVLASSDTGNHQGPRAIDVNVRRLRLKLGTEADLVRTVHGVGYVFNRGANVQIRYRQRTDD
jgi:DNA-binding response OmpR family regulator